MDREKVRKIYTNKFAVTVEEGGWAVSRLKKRRESLCKLTCCHDQGLLLRFADSNDVNENNTHKMKKDYIFPMEYFIKSL